jgi:hypothetical protein
MKNGYYEINGIKTYSKLEALESFTQHPNILHWNYNDEEFSMYDWTKEPIESIDDLYKEHALKLRNRYDKLILILGGIDSTNILLTCIKNNIPIDDIGIFYSKYDNQISLASKEVHQYTLPRLERFKEKYPTYTFNIRHIEYGDYILSPKTENTFIESNSKYAYPLVWSVNYLVRKSLFNIIPEYDKWATEGKKIGVIYGIDKPNVKYRNKNWIFNFTDVPLESGITTLDKLDPDRRYTHECFYWSPESVKILIKQCHLIKNFYTNKMNIFLSLQKPPEDYHINFSRNNQDSIYSGISVLHENIHQVIYPICSEENFMIKKPTIPGKGDNHIRARMLGGARELWLYASNHERKNLMYKINKDIQADVNKRKIDNTWLISPPDIYGGFRACVSKDYIFG